MRKLLSGRFTLSLVVVACVIHPGASLAGEATQDTQVAVRIEAAGTGATGQQASGTTITPGTRASVDLEITAGDVSYVRFRLNSGLNTYELKDAGLDYANMVVQPDIRGFTFAFDGSYAYWKQSRPKHRFTIGGSVRISAPTTWTITKDKMGMTLPMALSADVLLGSGQAGIGYLYRWVGGSNSVGIDITANASYRGIFGSGSKNQGLLNATLGQTDTSFLGLDLRMDLKVNDLTFFCALPLIWSVPNNNSIPGLTITTFIFGMEVAGNFIILSGTPASATARINAVRPD